MFSYKYMGESSFFEKSTEDLILEQGHRHQEKLQDISDNLKEKFNSDQLFKPETQKELDDWMVENESKVLGSLENIYHELGGLKSMHSPGHDLSHVFDNLNSACRIFEEFGDFSEAEKLEVVLSCLGHDVGRYVEKHLDKMKSNDVLFLMPAMIGRKEIEKVGLPESLQLRLLFDIASGPVPKTGHRTSDTVHQCDREYLSGARVVARGLAFDFVANQRELNVPLNDELKIKLPRPESNDDKYILTTIEFFMRNVYPSVSPNGAVEIDAMKREGAVIEMLATEGMKQKFEQVFAPELGLVDRANLHWSKKEIPREIFKAAEQEKNEFIKHLNQDAYTLGDEIEAIKLLMLSDKVSYSKDFEKVEMEKLSRCTNQERKNLWLIAKYALATRHESRLVDLRRLELTKKESGVSAAVAGWLIAELESREELYYQGLNKA